MFGRNSIIGRQNSFYPQNLQDIPNNQQQLQPSTPQQFQQSTPQQFQQTPAQQYRQNSILQPPSQQPVQNFSGHNNMPQNYSYEPPQTKMTNEPLFPKPETKILTAEPIMKMEEPKKHENPFNKEELYDYLNNNFKSINEALISFKNERYPVQEFREPVKVKEEVIPKMGKPQKKRKEFAQVDDEMFDCLKKVFFIF